MAAGTLTLLQVVQRTLEALGSDDVNGIADSVEATQIAEIARDAFYELLNQKEWPFLEKLCQLESIADVLRPSYLRIPDDVVRIEQLKYDFTNPLGAAPDLLLIRNLKYCMPKEFLDRVQIRNTEAEGVIVYNDFNGVQLPIFNDQEATFWTSFDDEHVVLDAWNDEIESTVEGIRSQALVVAYPDFAIDDDYVPDWPVHMFQLWLAEVKSTAFIYLRQEVSPKDEQRARRGLAVLRRTASRSEQGNDRVRYGRNPGGFSGRRNRTE